jgi:flagella basal body P-ring formation protein FlgA
MLIGVTQGFLEFTVEDYLATSQTEGRYEIQVNQLDPACACQCATRN